MGVPTRMKFNFLSLGCKSAHSKFDETAKMSNPQNSFEVVSEFQ